MAVRIIAEKTERLKKELEGSTFYYRRIPSHIRAEIVARHTARRAENPNWEKVMASMLAWGLLDWDDVEDVEGNPVEFKKDLVGNLPQTIQVELLDCLGGNAEELQAELGN